MDPKTYPVTFSVDYPDRPLNRLSTFFRFFAAIPIFILVATISGGSGSYSMNGHAGEFAGGGVAILTIPVVLMLLFRQKYPGWWYDWNLQLTRFSNRIGVYILLMDDRYPSTDEEQSVHLNYPVVDGAQLSRGLPIVKWLLAIPHYIILAVLAFVAFFAVVGAWFAILFTGSYPRGLFNFVEGVMRWSNRVTGYAFTLVTDEYPPFSLS